MIVDVELAAGKGEIEAVSSLSQLRPTESMKFMWLIAGKSCRWHDGADEISQFLQQDGQSKVARRISTSTEPHRH